SRTVRSGTLVRFARTQPSRLGCLGGTHFHPVGPELEPRAQLHSVTKSLWNTSHIFSQHLPADCASTGRPPTTRGTGTRARRCKRTSPRSSSAACFFPLP